MKTTIYYFGILLLMANSLFAHHSNEEQNFLSDTIVLKKPAIEQSFDNDFIIDNVYKKTIEETIREDNQIIDANISDEVFPLDLELLYQNHCPVTKAASQNRLLCKRSIKL